MTRLVIEPPATATGFANSSGVVRSVQWMRQLLMARSDLLTTARVF